jgi:hypothetical protein
VVSFCIAERGRAGNHLEAVPGSTQTGGTREVRQVPAVTLDSLLERSTPQLVKIDVEGAELLCLRGAERLLREVRPVLICEVAEENADEAGAILHRHGYEMQDAAAPAEERRPLERPVWNTVAFPQ